MPTSHLYNTTANTVNAHPIPWRGKTHNLPALLTRQDITTRRLSELLIRHVHLYVAPTTLDRWAQFALSQQDD